MLIALAIAAAFGALLYVVVFRPLREAPPLARAVASLGVLVVVEGLIENRVGQAPVSVSAIFPSARWHWGSLVVLSDRLYLVLTVVALALAITALYRWTRFGLLTRAVAETHTGAIVSGISPSRIALLNWMASAVVAGAAGILIAPITTLTPEAYTLAVIPALAAAVVGRFELMVPTVIAGIAIGMLQSEGLTLAIQHAWFPQTGSAELIPLLVILATFIVSGRGIPVRAGFVRKQLGRAPRPHSLLLPTIVGIAVGVLALVLTTGTWRNAVIGTLIVAILGLSYVVVTGFAGQVSLAQLALAGVSAFSLSVITQSWGIPFPIAPLLAALFASCVGVVVGLPALRLRGLTLGIVTLAFAYAIEALWFENGQFVNAAGATVKSPHLFGLDLGIGTGAAFPRLSFGLLCLVTLAAVALGVALAAYELAGFGHADYQDQRAISGRHRCERRPSQDCEFRHLIVYRRNRGKPLCLWPGDRDVCIVRRIGWTGLVVDGLSRWNHIGVWRNPRRSSRKCGHRLPRVRAVVAPGIMVRRAEWGCSHSDIDPVPRRTCGGGTRPI